MVSKAKLILSITKIIMAVILYPLADQASIDVYTNVSSSLKNDNKNMHVQNMVNRDRAVHHCASLRRHGEILMSVMHNHNHHQQARGVNASEIV